MKNLIPFLVCFFVLLSSCKKDAKILVDVCSTKIDIGDIYLSEKAKQSIPYGDDLELKSIFHKENIAAIGGLNINHPVLLEHREGVYDLASSCEDPDAWNQYLYNSEQHYSYFLIWREYYDSMGVEQRESQQLLVHATNRMGIIDEGYGSWGEYLRFYTFTSNAYHQLNTRDIPFMSVPINVYYKGAENTNDFGYEFFPSLDLNEKRYEKVYASTTDFYRTDDYFVKLYYTFEEGLVALEGKDGTVWTIHF